MISVFKKNLALNSAFTQMLIVVIAFTIMGVSSFFFASSIERENLIRESENALSFSETEIISSFLEPETFLNGYSETIRSMILRGESETSISAYMTALTNFLLRDRERLSGLVGSHGYFYNWGGVYISGRNWTPSTEYIPQETPWYKAALAAAGNIAISEPEGLITNDSVLTFSRYLMDEQNNPLGVVCLDIELNRIHRYATTMNLSEGSYGILLNDKLVVIAHPIQYMIGEQLSNIDSGLATLSGELELGRNIYERRVKNYMYEDSIVFFHKIKYGWYLGIVIPISEYYKNVNNMAAFLIIIGSMLAILLCVMLYRISKAKIKADLRTQQKSNFLATMSHEIRTPLNAIMGMTEIQMQNTSHPLGTSEAFIKINNSGNLLLSIINDILDLSKIEAGKLELTPTKYEVASLINDIVQLNYIRYESKPIEFKIEVNENIPSTLVGDELRIKQILNNLLSNAFKYTERGVVTLSTDTECVGRGGAVLVTLIFRVIDTGQGMTPDEISKLFDEYTRFNMEANRTTEGAGLGMTITRNLVELMHGKINVKSTVGEGTSVTVRIPQRTDGIGIRGVIGSELAENLRQFKLGNAVQIKKAQVKHEYMPYGRVLIVHDVETNLYVAEGLMAPYGLKIDLATSGFEAMDKIKEGNVYDIVFMDHMMPKLDGIETTKRIREKGYTSPIVALTANALAGQAEMFMKNGFDGFISKPIDIRQLNYTLNSMIRDKQPVEVIEAAHREKAEHDKKLGVGVDGQQIDPQLATIFARDAEKAIVVLENVLGNNFHNESDIQLFVINVHAMKSALANIGESKHSATALRLEQAGREKNINMMASETQKFIDDLRAIIDEIKPKDEDDIEDTEEVLVYLREKLIIIKEACMTYDKKSAKNTLNELRDKTWSHKTRDLLNLIAEHLLHSEFDDAAAIADEYVKA